MTNRAGKFPCGAEMYRFANKVVIRIVLLFFIAAIFKTIVDKYDKQVMHGHSDRSAYLQTSGNLP